ncbi:MAG: hypothetical protein NVV66_07220 [Cellulomonas sp.]|uniref:hypothetical protein n=1 Tax=Cellulomonas sp. TaxID=40001 RepID=UPI0025872B36|nr:hypothetical protein [Cellulomonas sp.]MCR6704483.1 hypothetical protein [Cellulomonas sp.]
MQQQEQDDEVGEELAVEDRLEVELDERDRGQRRRVAEQAQDLTVGHHRPQVVLGPVAEFLDHGVRRSLGRAGHALGPSI